MTPTPEDHDRALTLALDIVRAALASPFESQAAAAAQLDRRTSPDDVAGVIALLSAISAKLALTVAERIGGNATAGAVLDELEREFRAAT